MFSFKFFDQIRRELRGSYEFNAHRPRDSTRQLSRVGVGGVYLSLEVKQFVVR